MINREKKRNILQQIMLTIKTNSSLKVVLFFVSVILLSATVVFLIERKTNEGFTSFFDSFWWTIVTISTVGYGERVPTTVLGRVIALGTIFIGIGMMGTVTGRIASFLMERQMREENGLLDFSKLKGHFIICGWKNDMNNALYEILKFNDGLDPMQIVLLNKAPKEEVMSVKNDPALKGINYVSGDYMEERDLRRAGIKGASKILVLSDSMISGDIQEVDSKTVMAVMSIKNINKKAYVCAELLDTKFEKYLKLSHCDEIFLSRDFSRSILASASSGTGLSHVIGMLLSGSGDVQIETLSIPKKFIGKTYSDLKKYYNTVEEKIQLIGILENTGNITTRRKEALREVQKNPDISGIISDLQNVKTLSANDPIINPSSDYIIPKYASAIVISGSNAQDTKGTNS